MINQAAQAVVVQKTPAGDWDETINWGCPTRELGFDTISTSDWAFTGPDTALTLSDGSVGDPATTSTIWISGGTLGAFYAVTNTIITTGGRTLTGTFIVSVVGNIFLSPPRQI